MWEKEPKCRSCTTCPQYDGAVCQATGIWLGDKELILHQEARRGFICLDTKEAELKGDAALKFAEVWADDHDKIAKSVDDTMYHPNVVVDSTDLHSVTVCPPKESNTFKMTIRLVDSDDSAAGSPSSECPSRREGPPQKGKIDDHNSLRLEILRHQEATCRNCNKSHYEGLRLVCDKWGLQDIKMPERTCEEWRRDPEAGVSLPESDSPLSTTVDNASLSKSDFYAAGDGLQLTENPVPLWKDTNGYWEPVRPRSCVNCKLYNDPICMKMVTHIGMRQEILAKEEENGFLCFAADQMQREE